jgi:hypothetical protein
MPSGRRRSKIIDWKLALHALHAVGSTGSRAFGVSAGGLGGGRPALWTWSAVLGFFVLWPLGVQLCNPIHCSGVRSAVLVSRPLRWLGHGGRQHPFEPIQFRYGLCRSGPAGARGHAARDSLGAALHAAAQAGNPAPAGAVKNAFVGGMTGAIWVAAAIAVVGAIVALIALPARERAELPMAADGGALKAAAA